MGLSSALSNALAGMNVNQRGIDVVSRNVANQGTPGYHRQSLVLQETSFGASAGVRPASVSRAFDSALEKQHLVSVSSVGFYGVKASYLDRMQIELGRPGDPQSLDTLYSKFENALQAMATNPNDLGARAGVINAAQTLVEQLNLLTNQVQEMRRDVEYQMSNSVSELNTALKSLENINTQLKGQVQDPTARLAMLDERDRLVASISEKMEISVNYRDNGTVSLMTPNGVGLLDYTASQFSFVPTGAVSANDPDVVGQLMLRTPSGLEVDLVGQGLLTSGSLAGLAELRDKTLVDMQHQLDDIASALALAMNTADDPADDDLALDLFIDGANPYDENDIQGFAGRIRLNPDVIADPTLLVQYGPDISLGDQARPQFLLNNLKTMNFVSDHVSDIDNGGVRLSGRVGDLVSQMINHQGSIVANAQSKSSSAMYSLESVTMRMEEQYGVNIDEEMARLLQLQTAYSANARVISTVQELMNALLRM